MWKITFYKFSALLIALNLAFACTDRTKEKNKVKQYDNSPITGKETYKDPAASIDDRVEDLLSRMSPEEKVGQMTQICNSSITMGGSKELDLDMEKIGEFITQRHVGSFLAGTGSAKRWVDFITGMQKIAMEETRLGIPIIFGIDHVHGANYVDEGTILPHNLNLSCSFNDSIIRAGALVTAVETADLGMPWNFSPVLDIGKNANWPRLYETYGEDPYMCGRMGSVYIQAYQACEECLPYKLAACAKHFIGYSDPKYGWDRAPSEIPDQILYEQFVPSFERAIKEANVKTVMANSGEVNGVPVHRSKELLKDLLRSSLGFQGVIVTDIKDIPKIVEMHAGADNEKEATLLSLRAGIDMSMACNSLDFQDYLLDYLKNGNITMNRIDQSVRRILRLKFELGLFENPYPSDKRLDKIGCEKHMAIAEEAALESLVLLKNNGLLPLNKSTEIDITGFAANSKRMLCGPWTFEWMGAEEERMPKGQKTIYEALKESFGEVDLLDEHVPHFKQDKVAIITIGEEPYSEFKGSTGNLELDPAQLQMVKTAAHAGSKIILIYVGGRPRIIKEIEHMADAILFAGMPGEKGATAIAKVLSGAYNPSGRLSFTWPKFSGHVHPYYVKQSEFIHSSVQDLRPQYEFGHGESYSEIQYSKLRLSDTIITALGQEITATVMVGNNKGKSVNEAVLWFVRDEVGFITRPVKQLAYYEKTLVDEGSVKPHTFTFKASDLLGYPTKEKKIRFENGYYTLMVGDQKARFKLAMKKRVVIK